ncbi:EAL domain-containing protein [Rhizobium sp. BK176]|uniref:EAL domain-containing protein n=2 Tax=unclassified Rhizobium TaxID=2613769 RepID=UPI0021676A38|nr:EAL domain-containing protein [Rhizobium sp. BK176]MCS4096079.1 diguanylate cyclase (GGDEF)-like protein [Rhizobium sp. BK176]
MRKAAANLLRVASSFAGATASRCIIIAGMLGVAAFCADLRPIVQLDHALIAKRFSLAERPASGKIVFVAIDKRSIDQVGTWPWPRGLYGELLDRLVSAKVGDIVLDIDFSTPSTAEEDALLSAALERAGTGVLLPLFRQQASANSSETEISRPIPQLLDKSWPAFANVSLDLDGLVRRFSLGDIDNGTPTPSVAAALGGASAAIESQLVDFSITPQSVPTYSLSDVLDRTVGAAELAGRSVVVGGSATELKDIFPVPVYGALAGPLIHVLAAETLLQGRTLKTFGQRPLELLLATCLIAALLSFRYIGMTRTSGLLAAFGLIGEIAAYLLQRDFAFVIRTAVPWMLLFLAWVLALNERIDLGQVVAAIARTNASNTRRLMARIISNSSDGIVAFGDDLKIVEINESARSILKSDLGADILAAVNERVSRALGELVHQFAASPGLVRSVTVQFSENEADSHFDYEAIITLSPLEDAISKSGTRFGGCIIIRDITTRKRYEARLKRLSEEDQLTGLLSRREFLARIEGCDGMVAVLDVDRFSRICSTLGRAVGDNMLRAIANRLSENVEAVLARIDGDLFAIAWLEEIQDKAVVAEHLVSLFDEPLFANDMRTNVSVRLGAAPLGPTDPEEALRAAESALYEAKAGSTRWAMFDPATAQAQARSRRLEADMRTAMAERQFFLLFQPQINLATGRFVGAEALLRWRHPELGLISPAEFVPIAETSGLICEIGRWVLMEACIEASRWPYGIVAVNVSPIQFERSDVEAEVRLALALSRLPKSRLCIEMTESTFLDNNARSTEKMAALRAAGVALALDDFGTGYSSLSYLADLPLDKLKIDQSFVRRLTRDAGVMEIVKGIVSIAHGLGLEIVAEGIEGEAEMEALQNLRCETGQGYLFGKPQTASEMLANHVLQEV